jgi:hypothetical protein
MRKYPGKWTEADFESLSWHDNVVHGLGIRNPQEGFDFDLVFDIDHILEWIRTGDCFSFNIAPATLTFHGVDKLTIDIEISYKEDLEIHSIEREKVRTEYGPQKYRWKISLQSISGRNNAITFEARGFTQQLTKEPVGPTMLPQLEDEDR